MALAKNVNNAERDFLMEMEEAKVVTSLPMQHFVNKMGAQNQFTATEVAGVLGFKTSDLVYHLVESGDLEGIDIGTGGKRYYVFPRACLLAFLKKRCNKG